MPETFVTRVSPEEWRILAGLREIPPGLLRERVLSLMGELLAFAQEPHCAEMQADGVPCATAHTPCDEGPEAAAFVEELRGQAFGS